MEKHNLDIKTIHNLAKNNVVRESEVGIRLEAMLAAKELVNSARKECLRYAELESLLADSLARYIVREQLATPDKSYLSWNDPDYKGDDPCYEWHRYEYKADGKTYYIVKTFSVNRWIYTWS